MLCTLMCTVAFITGTFTGVLLTDIRKRKRSYRASALSVAGTLRFHFDALNCPDQRGRRLRQMQRPST